MFDLNSCLQLNFSKSNLIGVNFDPVFLDIACSFLHYQQDSPPFKYLGLPVGANPHLSLM